MDKFEQINTFVEICERGSMRAAADELGIDASRAGQRLKELEARLGTTLITRSTRSMSLTEQGKQYLSFCRQTLARMEEVEEGLRASRDTLSGLITISAPPFLTDRVMPPIMARLSNRLPNVRFQLIASEEPKDLLADGIDIAIRSGDLPDSQLQMRQIYSGKRRHYAAPEYLEEFGAPSAPGDLTDHKLLVFSGHRRHLAWQFVKGARVLIHRADPRIVSNNLTTLLEAARTGQGILRCSDWVVQVAQLQDELVGVLENFDSGQSRLSLVFPKDIGSRKVTQVALDELSSSVRQLL